jgi:hypothetical protein
MTKGANHRVLKPVSPSGVFLCEYLECILFAMKAANEPGVFQSRRKAIPLDYIVQRKSRTVHSGEAHPRDMSKWICGSIFKAAMVVGCCSGNETSFL